MARAAEEEQDARQARNRIDFVQHLLRTAPLIRRATSQALRAFKLTPEEWLVLEELVRSSKTQGELVSYTLRDRSSLTRLCDGLERRRLISRTYPEEDKRFTRVALTSRGQELVARARPAVASASKEWLGTVDTDDLQSITATFSGVREAIWDP